MFGIERSENLGIERSFKETLEQSLVNGEWRERGYGEIDREGETGYGEIEEREKEIRKYDRKRERKRV